MDAVQPTWWHEDDVLGFQGRLAKNALWIPSAQLSSAPNTASGAVGMSDARGRGERGHAGMGRGLAGPPVAPTMVPGMPPLQALPGAPPLPPGPPPGGKESEKERYVEV